MDGFAEKTANQGSLEALEVNVSGTCVLYNLEIEAHYHLFFECSFSRLICELFAAEVWIFPPADLHYVAAWINQPRVNADAHATSVIKLYFQSAIYLLWKERNARVFTPVSSPSSVILASLDRMMRDRLLSYPEKEKIVLPEDKTWPFLLRFPITSYGMCLGVSSQAIMWKTLATTNAERFLHLTQVVNHVLWWISLVLLLAVSITYLFKTIFFFQAVRREFKHPIRVNFFFAPLISVLFMALGIPHSITSNLPSMLWYFLMAPVLFLEMKIYGQWMSGGQRRLSKVANPTNHLAIIGNFAGALLGASMGLEEGPMFFFAVGLAYYLVLFVTLYQRLPTNETLPKELHPVFFLFVAAPAVASMAWTQLCGSFDLGSRFYYFISLFLYFSLVVRINFFRGFKFSLAWWAYTFPMTAVATATIKYSGEVTGLATQVLSIVMSGAATLMVIGVLVLTVMHAFVKCDLFPNDVAIAISAEQPKQKKWFKQLKNGSFGLKVSDKEDNQIDVEAPPLLNAHTV